MSKILEENSEKNNICSIPFQISARKWQDICQTPLKQKHAQRQVSTKSGYLPPSNEHKKLLRKKREIIVKQY